MDQFLKMPLSELILEADRTRKACIGARLDLCGIVNAKSGLCSEDCKFCAQSSRHKTNIEAYPLKGKSEIVKTARRAKNIGAERFGIVTSGDRVTEKELDVIARAISEIKTDVGLRVCASLGALSKVQLRLLKDAGLSRYHHNIETSARFYPRIVTTHTFRDRIETIARAKEAGLEACSGGIIGMGETWQDRIEMAQELKALGVDSAPVNILIPIKATPLESLKPISRDDAIRTIAIFRMILKDKTVKLAAGREAALGDRQAAAFMAGANGMIVGGYLTMKGALVDEDRRLVDEIRRLWTG